MFYILLPGIGVNIYDLFYSAKVANRPIADFQNKIFLTQRTQRAQSSTLLIAPTAQLTRKKAFSVPSVFSVTKSFFERALLAGLSLPAELNKVQASGLFYLFIFLHLNKHTMPEKNTYVTTKQC